MIDLVLTRPGILSKAEMHWGTILPLGPAYLASSVRNYGYTTKIIDAKFMGESSLEKTALGIVKIDPMVVGISTWTSDYYQGVQLAKKIKEFNPKIVTILGGPHVNALPNKSLSESNSIDYVIAGESEYVLPKFIEAIKNGEYPYNMPGLFYKFDGTIENRLSPEWGIDISNLPFPAWDFYPPWHTYPILTERGCPYQCIFCSHNLTDKLNSRHIENVIEEINWLREKYSPKRINIEDETFGINVERTELLLEEIIKVNYSKSMKFKAQTRVDRISLRTLKLMKRAGFDYLELGIESGDREVLAKSGKNIKLEQIEKAVKLAKEVGLKTWCNFIVGLLGETKNSIRNTINLGVKLNPDRISVSTIVAYPGSEIYYKALKGEDGIRFITKDWSSFDKYLSYSVELDTMSAKKMRRYQMQSYLEIYLRNFHFLKFFRMLIKHRHLAFSIIKSYITNG